MLRDLAFATYTVLVNVGALKRSYGWKQTCWYRIIILKYVVFLELIEPKSKPFYKGHIYWHNILLLYNFIDHMNNEKLAGRCFCERCA